MTRHDTHVCLRHMLDHVREAIEMARGRRREDLVLQRHIGSSNQAACADEVFQVIAIGGLTAWTPARLPSWVRN